MIAGGLLILIGSSMLSAIISIVFGLFPHTFVPTTSLLHCGSSTYHALELIWKI
jgi:hypothetical protein